MRLVFVLTVNLNATPANPGEIVVFSHVKCAGVMRVHSLVDFSAFQWSFCSHESRDTTKWPGMSAHNYIRSLGECRGGYDLWRRMCMYQKMWFVETTGSEQTSSAIMLWAKTRVYVCSGRAVGNERHLLFYARYEETWPHPTPILLIFRQCKWKWKPYAINPSPTPPPPILFASRSLTCWGLGCWIFWLLNPAVLVVDGCWIRLFGCWIRLFWLLNLSCWIRPCWLLNPAFWLNLAFLVAEALVAESFGCWIRLFWLLNLGCWIRLFGCWIRLFWLLNLSCWIRPCWLLNPAFWLNLAFLVAEALVAESFGCWIRLFWLLKLWLLNPVCLVVESEFFGCWIRPCWLLNPVCLVVESEFFGCWIQLFWLLKPWLFNLLVVESGFFGCWSLGCWIFWLLNPAFLVAEAMVVESVALVVESCVLVVEP